MYAVLAILGTVLVAVERRFPGRRLPVVRGWAARALLVNVTQLAIVAAVGAW